MERFTKSSKEDIEPSPWIDTSLKAFDAMGVDFEHRGSGVRLRMQGWPAAGNHIDVSAWYLKPPADPSRDVATVRAKVKASYASLFEPSTEETSRLLTVFMTEAGEIDRATLEVAKDKNVDPGTRATMEHFAAMGIAPERIGLIRQHPQVL